MATFTTNPASITLDNQPFTLTWTDTTFTIGQFLTCFLYINNSFIDSQPFTISADKSIQFNNVNYNNIGSFSVKVIGTNSQGDIVYNITAVVRLTITCFCKGTEILCITDKEEYIKVEDLKINTLVKTYKNESKKIVSIYKTIYKNDTSYHQICKISNYENQTNDLYLTGGHSILVDELSETEKSKTLEYWNEYKKINDKYLLLSCVNDNSVKIDDEDDYEVYHIVLDNDDELGQYGIYANGILTESMSIHCYKNSTKNILCIL